MAGCAAHTWVAEHAPRLAGGGRRAGVVPGPWWHRQPDRGRSAGGPAAALVGRAGTSVTTGMLPSTTRPHGCRDLRYIGSLRMTPWEPRWTMRSRFAIARCHLLHR